MFACDNRYGKPFILQFVCINEIIILIRKKGGLTNTKDTGNITCIVFGDKPPLRIFEEGWDIIDLVSIDMSKTQKAFLFLLIFFIFIWLHKRLRIWLGKQNPK